MCIACPERGEASVGMAAGGDEKAEEFERRIAMIDFDIEFAWAPVHLRGLMLSEAPVESKKSGTAAKLRVEGAGLDKFRVEFCEQCDGCGFLFVPEKEIAELEPVAIDGSGGTKVGLVALGVRETTLPEEEAQEVVLAGLFCGCQDLTGLREVEELGVDAVGIARAIAQGEGGEVGDAMATFGSRGLREGGHIALVRVVVEGGLIEKRLCFGWIASEFGAEGKAKEGGEITRICGEGGVEVLHFSCGIEVGEGEPRGSRRQRQGRGSTSQGFEIFDGGGMRSQPEDPGGAGGNCGTNEAEEPVEEDWEAQEPRHRSLIG